MRRGRALGFHRSHDIAAIGRSEHPLQTIEMYIRPVHALGRIFSTLRGVAYR